MIELEVNRTDRVAIIDDETNGKWRAAVRLGGKTHNLGYYGTAEEAGRVARLFRIERMPFSYEG